MQIAQIAPLTEAILPKFYGGTERVISWLADELVALGHDAEALILHCLERGFPSARGGGQPVRMSATSAPRQKGGSLPTDRKQSSACPRYG